MNIWQQIIEGFSLIIQYIYVATDSINYPSYGIAIILFTILVKLVLFPLTRMQIRSMSAMQEIQPKMKEIQDRYKDKPEKAREKMMKLYSDNNINPTAGCLPLLLQMPIIFALFSSLRVMFDPVNHPPFVDINNADFLWINNLGQPDPIILPILVVAATFGQQYMSNMASAGKIESTQKTMLFIMPLFVGWIARTLPAGLALYWVMYSIASAVEMVVIRKSIKAAKGAGSQA